MYARISTYLWWDAEGGLHEIPQAEGIEQGDPLAPGLYPLSRQARHCNHVSGFSRFWTTSTSSQRWRVRASSSRRSNGVLALLPTLANTRLQRSRWARSASPSAILRSSQLRRLVAEAGLLQEIARLLDLQCAWFLLA